MPDPTEPSVVVPALLRWYRAEARDLPWRRDPTPYHVLLSELMLQQTRVETVLPYFAAFTARWPTLADLAAADDQEVLSAWAGLGYYARARNLLRCARAAAASGLPSDPAALRALPGIGPYTAGAIASIAFGVRTPLVDGNVERVLCRLDARESDPRREGRDALWARAGELHAALGEADHPGDLNQALMELGATVCTPRQPRCEACPLAGACLGRAAGTAASLPRLPPRKAPVPMTAVAGILRGPQGVLLGRRPPGGLLPDLWEPVGGPVGDGEAAEAALTRAFAERAGLRVRVERPLGEVVHVFTHRRLVCPVYAVASVGPSGLAPEGYAALGWSEEGRRPLSALARKILALQGC